MLKLSLIGGLLVGITVLIHALGTACWVRHLARRFASFEGPVREEAWKSFIGWKHWSPAIKRVSTTANVVPTGASG